MTRYERHETDDAGWTGWIHPRNGYRMSCCDCGLVHELEFDVFREGPGKKAGWFTKHKARGKNLRVAFRARRNNRATAAVRRERKKHEEA